MAGDDGSIAIGVNLDDKQAQRDLARLERKIVSLQDKLKRAETERAPIGAQAQKLAARLDAATEKLRQMEASGASDSDLAEQKDLVKSLAAEYKQIDQLLVRYDNTIKKTNADIAWESNKAGELASQLAGAAQAADRTSYAEAESADRAAATAQAAGSVYEASAGAADETEKISAAAEEAEPRMERLGQRILSGVVQAAASAGNMVDQMSDRARAKLQALVQRIRQVRRAVQETGAASDEAGARGVAAVDASSGVVEQATSRLEKLGKRIIGLVKRVFVFSLITKALRGVRSYISEAIKLDDEAAQSLERLKGALLTLVQPLLQAVIPAITALANALTPVVTAAASFVSMLFGTTLEQSEEAAKGLNAQRNAINGVGGAAKSAAKSLAAFDTLTQVGEKESGSGSSAPTFTASKDFKAPEWLRNIDFTKLQESLVVLKEGFSELAGVVGGAFGWAWENILVPFGTWVIEEALPVVITLLGRAFSFLAAVASRLWPIIKPLWEKVLKPLGKWAGELVLKGLEELVDLLGDLTDLINGDISFDEFIFGLNGIQVAILGLAGFKVLGALATFGSKFAALPETVGKTMPVMKLKLAGLAKTVGLGALAVVDAYLVMYDVEKITEAQRAYDEAGQAYERSITTALDNYKYLFETKGKDIADEWAMMVYQIDLSGQDFETAQQTLADHVATLWGDAPKNWKEALVQGWDQYFGANGEGLIQLISDGFEGLGKWLRQKLGIENGLLVELGLLKPGTTQNPLGSSHASGTFATPAIAAGTVTPATRSFNAAAFVGDTTDGDKTAEAIVSMGNKILAAVQNQEFSTYLDGELVSQQLYSPMQLAAKRRGTNLIQGGTTR